MKIKFIDEKHKSNFERFCDMFGANLDTYRLAVAYLLVLWRTENLPSHQS